MKQMLRGGVEGERLVVECAELTEALSHCVKSAK